MSSLAVNNRHKYWFVDPLLAQRLRKGKKKVSRHRQLSQAEPVSSTVKGRKKKCLPLAVYFLLPLGDLWPSYLLPSHFSACGIFPDQGLNLCLLHWQADSLPLSHQRTLICLWILLMCHACKWDGGNVTKVGAVTAMLAELPSTLPAQKFNLFSFRVYILKICLLNSLTRI